LDFLARAVGWFSEQGVTCRRSSQTTAPPTALEDLAKRPVAPWISSPSATKALHAADQRGRPNGFIQNHPGGNGAYVIAYQTSDERNAGYPAILGIYNGAAVPHGFLGCLTPPAMLQALIAE